MKQDCTRKRKSIYFQDDALVSGCLFGRDSWKQGRTSDTRWGTEKLFATQYLHIYILYSRPNIRSMHPHYFTLSIFLTFRHATFILFLAFFMAYSFKIVRDITNQLSWFSYTTKYSDFIHIIHQIFPREGKRLFWFTIFISGFFVLCTAF